MRLHCFCFHKGASILRVFACHPLYCLFCSPIPYGCARHMAPACWAEETRKFVVACLADEMSAIFALIHITPWHAEANGALEHILQIFFTIVSHVRCRDTLDCDQDEPIAFSPPSGLGWDWASKLFLFLFHAFSLSFSFSGFSSAANSQSVIGLSQFKELRIANSIFSELMHCNLNWKF